MELRLSAFICGSALFCTIGSYPAPAAPESPPPATRNVAAGTYVDVDGERHAWRVTAGHALTWDGRPYLPVGAVFRAGSLSPDAREARNGEAAWERDVRMLDALKSAGVSDLTVRAERGLLAAPSGALARLVEALKERGFRYGLEINDRPQAPPRGFWLQPIAIDVPAAKLAPGSTSRWSVPIAVPGADAALWALVEGREGSGLRAGQVPVKDGRAEIEVQFRPARRIFAPGSGQLLVVPIRRLVPPGAGAGVVPEQRQTASGDGGAPSLDAARALDDERGIAAPDLWASLPAYREALLRALKEISWGPGLRFFLDPLVVDAGLRGDVEELLPASEAFRVELEAWLQRHGGVGDISVAWGLSDRHLDSLQVAARLVPLWRRDESGPGTPPDGGAGWFLDPETFDLYRVDRRRSRFWFDLERFRGDSARHAMNVSADLLKQRVAEVPVLYRWTQLHPAYTNRETVDGWDGLVFRDEGTRVASSPTHTLAAALTYAQCEGSARTLWCLGYGERASAEGVNAVRAAGARGYFVENPSSAGAGDTDVVLPLSALKSERDSWAADPAAQEEKPSVIFFPTGRTPGVGVTRLPNGVWWLPSFATGKPLILGEGLEGYQIDLPFADQPAPTTCVWATTGPQKATFVVSRELPVAVYDSLGRPVKVKSKRGKLQLELTETPYLLTGLQSESVFPVEAAAHALSELEALMKLAEARKLNPNLLTALKAAVADAKAVFTERTAATAYDLIRGPLESLRDFLSPYLWIEGERPREHTFSGVAPEPAASQGAFLSLGTARAPSGGAYTARYMVSFNTGGLYDLWLAGSEPGSAGASPLRWDIAPVSGGEGGGEREKPSINTQPLRFGPPRQTAYAPGLTWTRLGSVRLDAGKYLLTLAISEHASSAEASQGATPAGDQGRFNFRIDALLFAREPFTPQGTRRPSWKIAGRG